MSAEIDITPDCGGHLDISTDLCATCERYIAGGRRAARVELHQDRKRHATCQDYSITDAALDQFVRDLPWGGT